MTYMLLRSGTMSRYVYTVLAVFVLFSCVTASYTYGRDELSGSRVTLKGIRSVCGSPSGLIQPIKKPPAVDGMHSDAAWRKCPAVRFRFVDPGVAGYTYFPSTVKFAHDGSYLYILFRSLHGNRFSTSRMPADRIAILNEPHFAFLVHFNTTSAIIAVSTSGSLFHGTRKTGSGEWDKTWDPGDITVESKKANSHLTVEMRIGLSDIKGLAGDLPMLWKSNAVFKTAPWRISRTGKPGKGVINMIHAWKSSLSLVSCAPDSESWGRLYFDRGREGTVRRSALIEASAQAAVAEQEERARLSQRPEGIEFSIAEMKELYGNKPVMHVPVSDQKPEVDGDPGDQAWKHAEPVQLGFLSRYLKGVPDVNRTYVRLLSDRERLYALYECEESNTDALEIGNAQFWQDDVCSLLLDVGRSQDISEHTYFTLEVNPKGICRTGTFAGPEWNPKSLVSKGRVLKDKWIVELSVSFKDLGIDPSGFPKVWGANFCRSRAAERGGWQLNWELPILPNTEFAWAAMPVLEPHHPDLFGILYFEAGNALPEKLVNILEKRSDKRTAKIPAVYKRPDSEPGPVPHAPSKTAEFVAEPGAVQEDDILKISFEVDRPVDVCVSIADNKGEIVRHLAAGMLGTNAPRPFKASALRQEIFWDFKDDCGRAVPEGTYRVQVGLGLEAQFDRVFLGDPNYFQYTSGICTDDRGQLYVLSHQRNFGTFSTFTLRVFDREGRFIRQIMPYPGNFDLENVRGGRVIELDGKRWMPTAFQAWTHLLYPEMQMVRPHRPAVTKQGNILLVNSVSDSMQGVPKRIFRIRTDGSVKDDFVGPLVGRECCNGNAVLALSPDHRYVYVAGLGRPTWGQWGHKKFKPGWNPTQVVFRIDLKHNDIDTPPAPFIGQFGIGGSSDGLLNDPRGIAVDPQGRIYVAEYGNNRISVFSAAGRMLRSVPVEKPIQLEVHPESGAMYVLTRPAQRSLRLLKMETNEKAETAGVASEFKTRLIGRHICPALICLDSKSEEPVIWLARGNNDIFKIIDRNGKLRNSGNPIAAHIRGGPDTFVPRGISSFEISHDKKLLHCRGVFDVKTGERVPGKHTTYYCGLDGKYYTLWRVLKRFDENLKPLPFEKAPGGIKVNRNIFFAADPKGNIYVPHSQGIAKYGPDGGLINRHHIRIPIPGSSSYGAVAPLFCDREGNIYMVSPLRRASDTMPPMFRGRLPRNTRVKPGPKLFYDHFYGSIAKFGPEGGEVRFDSGGDMMIGLTYGGFRNCTVTGLKWLRLCVSPNIHRNKDHCACSCERSEPAMDGFGRLFIPDALRYTVTVLDTNGNRLLDIGKYGTWPDMGQKETGIGLSWPVCVRVTDTLCFVNDKINHRILKLKLGYKTAAVTEVTCK